MTQEEFQNLVLEKLVSLDTGQRNIETRLTSLETGQANLEKGQRTLENQMNERFDQLERIQQDDVIAMLRHIDKKVTEIENGLQAEINVIGAKVYRQELRQVK